MADGNAAADVILIVDDEESVRRTFQEWLEEANLGCRILAAADAEAALLLASRQTIDLAVLDWNLGAGHDGLRLLEDLYLFNPDLVSILVTGYAHQATPLDAMRMGVRDYLDKNQDLGRDTFLRAVRRQLDRLRPAKRERKLHQGLAAFREAVEKVLPLVQSAAALNDPVPLPQAVRGVFSFLLRTTAARDGVLLVRYYDATRDPPETFRVYDQDGSALQVDLVPFAQSVAGTAVSLGEPCAMTGPSGGAVRLQPFERDRQSLLAAPIAVAPGVHVVLELFDKRDPTGQPDARGFTDADRRLAAAVADFGAELLRQALAERQMHGVLVDAIEAALRAGDSVAQSLATPPRPAPEQPPPAEILDTLRDALRTAPGTAFDAGDTVRLAEAVRVLALRHGPPAVRHCIRLVESVRELLDSATGSADDRPPPAP